MAEAESRLDRFKQELLGVGLVFFSAFLFISLVSYRVNDPSFFTKGAEKAHNYGGLVGSYLSALFYQGFGLVSFLIFVLLFFAAGFKLFRKQNLIMGRSRGWLILRGTGISMLILFSASLLSLLKPELVWRGIHIKSAGWIGYLISHAAVELFSPIGAFGVLLLMFLVSLVLGFNLSITQIAKNALDIWYAAYDHLGELINRWREKRRREAEVDEQKKILSSYKTQQAPLIVERPNPEESQTKKEQTPTPAPRQEKLSFMPGSYSLPSLKLLDAIPASKKPVDKESILLRSRLLEKKLLDFGVAGEVVQVSPGPVITMYEFKPASGIKLNRIANLADDLACALSALSVRIVAPLPGKGVVGIEIPNQERETVYLKELIASPAHQNNKSMLTLALGKSTVGEPFVIDLRKAPHLLVAGATGSGKSVSLNGMIMSVLFRASPDQVRMLHIDPKRLELTMYEGIPHLLHSVISDPKEAAASLKWAVAEMERRYSVLSKYHVRDLDSYNRMVEEGKKGRKKRKLKRSDGSTVVLDRTPNEYPEEHMPIILVIIDELADLMMVAQRDCEASLTRLAQMARASGIHLILATQRPSVDVITGLIKANFPARISFQVSSKIDSRTILDQNGAEKLLGMGDMLYMDPRNSHLVRVHGAYVSEAEIKRVVSFWKKQGHPDYNESIIRVPLEADAEIQGEVDDFYEQAIEIVVLSRQASISMLQRKLRVGYNRAARMIERMQEEGIVSAPDGARPREVLIDPLQYEARVQDRMKGEASVG